MLRPSYLVRNLGRHRSRTVATVACVAFTTFLVVVMTAFARGLAGATEASARDDVMVLVGAASELDLVRSVVPRGSAETAAASAPGVLTIGDAGERRAASVELHVATRAEGRVGLLRGVTAAAYLVHPEVTVIEGNEPRAPFELMAGRLAATRMGLPEAALEVGDTIVLERRTWTVTGRFAAPGTVFEAEMWARLQDLMQATKREDVSCVTLRLADPSPSAEARVKAFAASRQDLEIFALPERELMATIGRTLDPIVRLARWMAVLVACGGAFACANTMFAAVLARIRELGTLRALGWSPLALSLGLLVEAVLVAFLGAALGLGLAWLFGGVQIRYPMGALPLIVDAQSRAIGLATSIGSGVLGGLVPAFRAMRIPLPDALAGRA